MGKNSGSEHKQRTSSIIHRINAYLQSRAIRRVIGRDIALLPLLTGICMMANELQYGRFSPLRERVWSHGQGLRSICYSIELGTGETATIQMGETLFVLVGFIGLMFIVQLIGWALDWFRYDSRLRGFMRPIDKLALEAEKLSLSGISEEKIQNVEEAIDKITAVQSSISIGDSDLKGLENAINNLLKRLKLSYREQNRFVDDASHELRTPISVIQGYASMLERWGMEDRATLEEAVHAIREEADHMKTLVDQLLFLARGDGGRLPYKPERINATELMKEIREESEMIDGRHRYLVKAEDDVMVMGDPAMLKQAVRIFVDNAAKYTPEGGSITLGSARDPENGNVLLSVEDEGIGFEAEEAAHLFERFFRGDEVRGKTNGSGLGLSIARWIADRHGATIEVLSFKGVGTRMTLRMRG